MLEHWTYNYGDRVFSTPIINLSEVEGARRELEYLLDNGVKVALIKPGPVNGIRGWRSPVLPERLQRPRPMTCRPTCWLGSRRAPANGIAAREPARTAPGR